MIVFKNLGSLDVDSVTTFGVCAKEHENPIGYFGTGLKYAIAVLLRTHHSIKIITEGNEYKFSTEKKEIRGKEFLLVTMNDKKIGFTTELGKNWEVWQAFRELYCNCLDEHGVTGEHDSEPVIKDDETAVIVHGAGITDSFHNKNKYFIEEEKCLFKTDTAELYNGNSTCLYYRGVRALDLPKVSINKYNIISSMMLSEDRTLRDVWSAKNSIGQMLCRASYDLAYSAVTANNDYIESEIDYLWSSAGEEFLNAVGDALRDRPANVNSSAKSAYYKFRKIVIEPDYYTPQPQEMEKINKAITYLEKINIKITYPIVYVESLGSGVLAQAKDGKIFITRQCLMMGDTTILGALLEEYLHLKHGFKDESRELQTYLFELVASLLERL